MQDVVFKVIAKDVPFRDASELAQFANHAAEHLRIDRLRKLRRRRTDLDAAPDAAIGDDAEVAIEALTAARAWERLSQLDRRVLLTTERRADQAEYRRRSRARARLASILATLEGWLAWLRAHSPKPRVSLPVSGAALAVFVVIAVSLTQWLASPVEPRGAQFPPATHSAALDGFSPTSAAAGANTTPDVVHAPPPRYRELVSAPTGRVVVSAGSTPVVMIDSRPTEAHDPLVCVHRWPVIGTHCIGDATTLLP